MSKEAGSLKRSRSTLFLIEQIVAVAVFSVCAAVCVSIFINAFLMAHDARDTGYGLIVARNTAEAFKVTGAAEETLDFIRGHADGTSAVYFGNDWRIVSRESAAYVLRLRYAELVSEYDIGHLLTLSYLTVERICGESIVSFTVAARRAEEVVRNE